MNKEPPRATVLYYTGLQKLRYNRFFVSNMQMNDIEATNLEELCAKLLFIKFDMEIYLG